VAYEDKFTLTENNSTLSSNKTQSMPVSELKYYDRINNVGGGGVIDFRSYRP